jgi:hypothetical protein
MEDHPVKNFLASGLLYELAGFAYYIYFMLMSRGANAARFTKRSRVLVLIAAIILVASVPLHYANSSLGTTIAIAVALSAFISTFLETRQP